MLMRATLSSEENKVSRKSENKIEYFHAFGQGFAIDFPIQS